MSISRRSYTRLLHSRTCVDFLRGSAANACVRANVCCANTHTLETLCACTQLRIGKGVVAISTYVPTARVVGDSRGIDPRASDSHTRIYARVHHPTHVLRASPHRHAQNARCFNSVKRPTLLSLPPPSVSSRGYRVFKQFATDFRKISGSKNLRPISNSEPLDLFRPLEIPKIVKNKLLF